MSYPVALEMRLPARFDRAQLVIRLVVLSLIGVLHQTGGSLLAALYLVLPVIVALLIGASFVLACLAPLTSRLENGFLFITSLGAVMSLLFVLAATYSENEDFFDVAEGFDATVSRKRSMENRPFSSRHPKYPVPICQTRSPPIRW